MTDFQDDDISHFAAHGTPPLPEADTQGHVEHDGARIWYATYGAGPPVILLHGGLGHGGNWSHQVPALTSAGYRAILIDSRGHGRSTRDSRPLSYEAMASDVLSVMDTLNLERAAFVGWSDGAIISLILAMRAPSRVSRVFFFGGNMDTGGVREITWPNPILMTCLSRHAKDYASLSATPGGFMAFARDVETMMKTQPNYAARDLAAIQTPVAIVRAEHDEFIKPEHAEYLARHIPGAELIVLPGVSHFAPLQRPAPFNDAMRAFLDKTP
ncbi:MAG: alpha/beta fold hydrolase [Alphaproteobacteria bacterium]